MTGPIAWHLAKASLCLAGAVIEIGIVVRRIREKRQDAIWLQATLEPDPAKEAE